MRGREPKQRGDTVVEVLIAVSIIGVVLGSSSVVVNRNIKTNIATQEHLNAIKLTDQQVELFRVAAVKNDTLLSKTKYTSFCLRLSDINAANTDPDVLNRLPASCTMNEAGTIVDPGSVPSYIVTVKLEGTPSANTVSETAPGARLHINVTWDSVYGNTKGNVDNYAEVYIRG